LWLGNPDIFELRIFPRVMTEMMNGSARAKSSNLLNLQLI
jgi:hypothetical protein